MKGLVSSVISTLVFTSSVYGQVDPNSKINLALVPQNDTPVLVGETISVRLEAVANDQDQRYVVADVVFAWDNTKLEFIGIDHTYSHPLIWRNFSGLPYCAPGQASGCGDYYGLNEVLPPADGNGLYFGYNILGSTLIVSSTPITIVDFKFKIISPFTTTEVQLLPQYTVYHTAKTVIYGSNIPGMPVTGTLTNGTVIGAGLAGDFNGDGVVGAADLADLMANWGVSSFAENPYDLSGDGVVNGADLAMLFGYWSA